MDNKKKMLLIISVLNIGLGILIRLVMYIGSTTSLSNETSSVVGGLVEVMGFVFYNVLGVLVFFGSIFITICMWIAYFIIRYKK